MAGKYWEANPEHLMNDEQEEMRDLANHVSNRAQYSDLDEPTQNQLSTLIGGAMKHIFNSQDNHFAGRYKAAHSNLRVAGKHIADAARLVDGVNGGHTNWGTAMHPADYAEGLGLSYKHGYEV